MPIESVGTPALWVGFTRSRLAMLALDLGVFHRKAHDGPLPRGARLERRLGRALARLQLLDLPLVRVRASARVPDRLPDREGALGRQHLRLPRHLLVFAVPTAYQHRVLFWGILGALLMRAIVHRGSAPRCCQRFHWVIYVFGAFLIFTGIKLLRGDGDAEPHPERNPIYRLVRRFVPAVDRLPRRGTSPSSRTAGATPRRCCWCSWSIEATDSSSRVDSIPAIFAVTTDPFIVYTSNIFAILGLRALYFLLAGALDQFRYLKSASGSCSASSA